MAITITDTGASITITNGTQTPRNILKAQIIELTIIKTNVLKIDIGRGPFEDIFIPHPEVSFPVAANPNALKNAVNTMLAPAVTNTGPAGGVATAPKQDQHNLLLTNICAILETIYPLVETINNKVFYQPLLIDAVAPETTYKGYALPGSSQELFLWAVERIQMINGVETHTWSDGSRNLDKRWIERKNLIYY